ncbi:MAG: hypothetical protein FVQ80_11440 [Planctomycetes bacterium]|nr:hypothetical protein [Planctomycetota bacterium]
MEREQDHLEVMMAQVQDMQKNHKTNIEQINILGSIEYNINRLAMSFIGRSLTWKHVNSL